MATQRKLLLVLAAGLLAGAFLSAASLSAAKAVFAPTGRNGGLTVLSGPASSGSAGAASGPAAAPSAGSLEKDLVRLEASRRKIASRIARLQPQGTWILIDTGANRIYLMEGEKVVREAICSTGSGRRLEDPQTGRKWIFNTPRGEFEIRTKKTNPIWIKPDWEFVEEGKPIPTDFKERVEEDMLGDYAMDLGEGYLIHGTLYKRALGMSVTHGCVRVGDADLEVIYKAARIGTRVYII